jgi:hypothetical protein
MSETMSQPATIQDEPWTNFPKLSYSFIHDHFVHDHRAVLKLSLRNANGGAEVSQQLKHSDNGFGIYDETKFWMSLPGGRSFFGKVRTG